MSEPETRQLRYNGKCAVGENEIFLFNIELKPGKCPRGFDKEVITTLSDDVLQYIIEKCRSSIDLLKGEKFIVHVDVNEGDLAVHLNTKRRTIGTEEEQKEYNVLFESCIFPCIPFYLSNASEGTYGAVVYTHKEQ